MSNISIISNVINPELYELSKSFYSSLEYEKLVVDGNNMFYGVTFLDYILKDKKFDNIDWVIYIDEDCFITDIDAMLELLNYQIENNIHCSGMPDGGVVSHRYHNPISINAFFIILNLGEIRKKYNSTEALSMKYKDDLEVFIPYELIFNHRPNFDKFNRTLPSGQIPYGTAYDNYEPYYKIFFWLLRNNFKILYLDAYDYLEDDWTTVLKNHKGIDFAYHTWYARMWDDIDNKKRILKIYEYCKTLTT